MILNRTNKSILYISDIHDIIIIISLIANRLSASELILVTILQKYRYNLYINYYYNLYTFLILTKSLFQVMEITYQDGHERS